MATLPDPFGLHSADMVRSPYPIYARLRAEAPVHYEEAWDGFLVTRYRDVAAGFRDGRLSANRAGTFGSQLPEAIRARLAPVGTNLAAWALLMDPPDHTRIRSLINKSFTPKVVQRMRGAIEELAALLVGDAIASGGVIDIARDLAGPLPVIVIGDLLGLPRDDRHRLKELSDALAAFLGAGRPTLETIERASRGIVEMEGYFRDALAARRRAPGEDLLSMLVAAEEGGVFLGEQEIVSTCTMLLFGGHETTTNLITNAVHNLLAHPAELAKLRATPAAIPNAIEEVLRFESPVQRMGRVTREHCEVAGVMIPAGKKVWLYMGSAHRDPEQFRDPDRFDVTRDDVRHLAFGLGTHYCVGATLGRMEAQAALAELLRRCTRIEPAYDQPAWADNITIRGPSTLPVTIDA